MSRVVACTISYRLENTQYSLKKPQAIMRSNSVADKSTTC